MSTLRLVSSRSDAVVEFSEVEGEWFRISVVARDHSATRRISAHTDEGGVARLFAEAARDWKGWKRPKVWESLERDLRLELTADSLGHVTLAVSLRQLGGSDPWQLEAEIVLDAGQLARIARDAEEMWSGK